MDGADEGRHPPTPDPRWCEQWSFDAWTPDGAAGCYAVVTLLPNLQQAWYWAALVRPDEPLVSVVDLDQPMPVTGLRLRSGQLWADHTCEVPMAQWTIVNETYAVALDDPDEALGRALGTPTPVAFDLEWYATAAPVALTDGYVQDGVVHGVIELQGGKIDLDGLGRRRHTWGVVDWSAQEGTPVEGVRAPVLLDVVGRRVALDHALDPGGWHRWRRPLA